MKNWGYPNDKIYLSYATTTSSGSGGAAVVGYSGLDLSNYTMKKDGSLKTLTVVSVSVLTDLEWLYD